jgi:hypothetical protein
MNLVDYLVLTADPPHRQARVIREKIGNLTPYLRAHSSEAQALEQIDGELGGKPQRLTRSAWKELLRRVLDALVGLEHWNGPASGPVATEAGEGPEALTSG